MDVNDFSNDEREPTCRRLDFESIDEVHARIPQEFIPKVGMEFKSKEDAFDFYSTYAKKAGFGVRKWRDHTDKKASITWDVIYCCAKQGQRKPDVRDATVKKARPLTRCDCTAEIKICCRETAGKYYRVKRFSAEHNHPCVTPYKVHLIPSHRRMSEAQKVEVDTTMSFGIAQRQTMELMANQVGGPENLGFTAVDCKNYLRTKRMNAMNIGETGGVFEYLQRKQSKDPNFFYAIQVDLDGLITNIFWADAKMRSDYSHFGDVVSFDTTYRKHKDGRPVALFVGANNHKQTIIFGVALLFAENTQTFEWLFDTFAQTMSKKMPQTILTDQDKAMSNALQSKWKDTYHRLCVWHINQNAAKHLSNVFTNYKDFSKDFSSCMYDHDEEEDFIDAWNKMIVDYGLEDNEWLDGLFKIRKKWALVYGRETFCADMCTTQRSESINSAIKSYISYKHGLTEFFEHFERLLRDHRYKELKANYHANQSTPSLSLPVQILRHDASVYTQKIFECFQAEVCKAIDCHVNDIGGDGTTNEFDVAYSEGNRHHRVTYDSRDNSVSCGCKKYEFVGFLCSHIVAVLLSKHIRRIPDKYIMKRWMKIAKKHDGLADFRDLSQVDPKELMIFRDRELSRLSRHLVSRASETKEAYEIAKVGLQKLLEQIDACCEGSEVQELASSITTDNTNTLDLVNHQQNGNDIIKKVRGIKRKEKVNYKTSKRPKSCLEKKKPRKKGPTSKKGSNKEAYVVPTSESTLNQDFENYYSPILPSSLQEQPHS